MASLRLSILLLLTSAWGIKGLSLDEVHFSRVPAEPRSDSLQRALDSVSHRRRLLDRKRSPDGGGDPWRRLPTLKRQAEEVEDFFQVQEESDDPRWPVPWISSLSEGTPVPLSSETANRKMAWLIRQLQEAVRDDAEHSAELGSDQWSREQDRINQQEPDKDSPQGRHWLLPDSEPAPEPEGNYFLGHGARFPQRHNAERLQDTGTDSIPGHHRWWLPEPPAPESRNLDEDDNNIDRKKRRPWIGVGFSGGRNEKRFTDGSLTTFDLYNRRYGRHQFRSFPLTPRTAFFQSTDDGPLSGSSDDFHDEVLISRKRKRQAPDMPPPVPARQMAAKAMSRKPKVIPASTKKKNKKKTLKPGEFFDYASGAEHHSTYWDPSYSSMNLPQGYGEGAKRESNRARLRNLAHQRKEGGVVNGTTPAPHSSATKATLDKVPPQKEVPLRLRKRSEPITTVEHTKALSKELSQILQDDDSGKKINNTSDFGKKKERKLREATGDGINLEDEQEQEQEAAAGSLQKSKFNEWLKQEYYKTLSTTKRKRSEWTPLVSKDIDNLLEAEVPNRQPSPWRGQPSPNSRKEDEENTERYWRTMAAGEGEEPFIDVEDKLRNIRDLILYDALALIDERARPQAESELNDERVASRLEAAYDLEKMRLAMEHLRDTMQRMEGQEVAIREEDDRRQKLAIREEDDRRQKLGRWSTFPELQKRDKNLADALHVMAPSTEKREEVEEDALDPGDACPPLRLLTSDCSAVADVLSHSSVRQPMVQACNWHEVCYTCGEAYGLTASDCDVGFMEASRVICRESGACEAMARLLLLPLHQKRVFFKRSIPATCFSDPCVDRFLGQR